MATLHLLCGRIAAGKSTLATDLAEAPNSVLLCQDHWLSSLYPGEIKTLADYDRSFTRLRTVIEPLVEDLLRIGVNVVLDFPANTVEDRAWMRQVFQRSSSTHILHYLETPEEVCRQRLHLRNAGGRHPYTVSDEEFDEFTQYFVPPEEAEGFNVLRHTMDRDGSSSAE